MRIVLTVVGLSLVEKFLNQNLYYLAKSLHLCDERDLPDVERDIRKLREDVGDLLISRDRPAPDQMSFTSWRDRFPELQRLTDILRALWRSASDKKRDYGPVEFASLSLLACKLGAGDQVWLLSSETQIGALCSAVLGEVLRSPGAGSSLCGEEVAVRQVLLKGVQMWDPGRLAQDGFFSWAVALDSAQQAAAGAKDAVLLNITGGFKGVAPLGTLLAMGLSKEDKRIAVFYLYEDSDKLFYLPGTDLVGFDLSLFDRFKGDWNRFPPSGLSLSEADRSLTTTFRHEVIGDRLGLVLQVRDRLEITAMGQLLLGVWQAKNGINRPEPPLRGI